MSSPHPPPGWHPDPLGGSDRRWWDGSQWTTYLESTGLPPEPEVEETPEPEHEVASAPEAPRKRPVVLDPTDEDEIFTGPTRGALSGPIESGPGFQSLAQRHVRAGPSGGFIAIIVGLLILAGGAFVTLTTDFPEKYWAPSAEELRLSPSCTEAIVAADAVLKGDEEAKAVLATARTTCVAARSTPINCKIALGATEGKQSASSREVYGEYKKFCSETYVAKP